MKQSRLLRTSAVRLALRYAAVALLLGLLTLGTLYWAISQYVDSQLRSGLQQEFSALLELADDQGIDALIKALNAPTGISSRSGSYTLLTDASGQHLAGNLIMWPPEDAPLLDGNVHIRWVDDDAIPSQHYDDDAFWPVVASQLPGGNRLMLAHSIEGAESMQRLILYILVAILGFIVIMALAMGLTMGQRMLSRVDSITMTAANIMHGDLSSRMPVSDAHDEFDALSGRLNQMLARIQQLIQGLRATTDNISHDMRAPLTTLRNRLDVALLEKRSNEEYRETIEAAVEDLLSIIRTFNALLEIAKVESDSLKSSLREVDLCAVAHDVIDLLLPIAESRNQHFCRDLVESATVSGIPDLITQALGNLVENAIKFTPDGGHIAVRVSRSEHHCVLCVCDDGPGIPQQQIEHVQERFSRLDAARNTPGNGLGLAMVKAVASLHGAQLQFSDAQPGLRVELRFACKQS